jgi:hypothetical protein
MDVNTPIQPRLAKRIFLAMSVLEAVTGMVSGRSALLLCGGRPVVFF